MSRKQSPSDFLKQIIGRPVVVKLNSGVDYRGKSCTNIVVMWFYSIKCFSGVLAYLDGYMNIALEQTEEYVNGQVRGWKLYAL